MKVIIEVDIKPQVKRMHVDVPDGLTLAQILNGCLDAYVAPQAVGNEFCESNPYDSGLDALDCTMRIIGGTE